MKVFGYEDNSEAFSLILTAFVGVLLLIFTFTLHRMVMSSKNIQPKPQQQVNPIQTIIRPMTDLFPPLQAKTLVSSKQLFGGISKETARDISKLN